MKLQDGRFRSGAEHMAEQQVERESTEVPVSQHRPTKLEKAYRYVRRFWFVYLLALPAVLHTFLFKYVPMYGLLIAFKDYNIRRGILRSPWVGLENFRIIIQDAYFYKVLTNQISTR